MAGTIITDAELLGMSLASEALAGIDVAVRLLARQAASAIVLASVKKRYAVDAAWSVIAPGAGDVATDAPFELKDAAAALAAYRLLARRGVSNRDPTKLIVDERNKLALEWLVSLVDGEVELVDVDPTKGAPLVRSGRGPRWTRDALLGYDIGGLCTGHDRGDGVS